MKQAPYSNIPGVHWHKRKLGYEAQWEKEHLGTFKTEREAAEAIQNRRLYGRNI